MDRIFGLYDLHVTTATDGYYINGYYIESERAHIDGINAETTEALKKIILEKIRENTKSTL